MRIYVAASWRTPQQPAVVRDLRILGHKVYDFRDHGFAWSEIDEHWMKWTPGTYRAALDHPAAERGFRRDYQALQWCEALIMVQPCGSSAMLELGFVAGLGKPTAIYMPAIREPDLMVKVANLITYDWSQIKDWLNSF